MMSEEELKELMKDLSPEKLREVKLALGMIKERKQRTTKERVETTIPDEYYVTYHFHCRLCGTHTQEHFHMVQDKKVGGLVSRRVDEIPPSMVRRDVERTTNWCNHCSSVLMKMEKEDVVRLMLNYVRSSHILT